MTVPDKPSPEVLHDLGLAVIASSDVPLLLLDDGFAVIVASASFFRTFQLDPAIPQGQSIFGLGSGEWDVPQLRSLLRATAAGYADIEAYEMDLAREGRETRRLVLKAHVLAYGDGAAMRLILAVSDVTEARLGEKLKEELLRDKALLHQELAHRVANSLQIIASVLMQSARKVQSEETRGHLRDAHNRVLSVAALQRHLATSRVGDVALRGYLGDLCGSIGASMISDHAQLSLSVDSDDSVTTADVSMSIGLIVTELVINALKHAFPDHREGRIVVSYHSQGSDWTLEVRDDGVGMGKAGERPKSGLGTSIVAALATQLHARIEVADARPGTAVHVAHTQAATLAGHANDAERAARVI